MKKISYFIALAMVLALSCQKNEFQDEADTPVITTDMKAGNMVTINFSNTVPGNNGTFYIPAPLGSYGSVTAEVLDGDATLVSKTWHEQTVSRMTPKRGAVEVEYVAEIDGKIYKNLQAAIDASE